MKKKKKKYLIWLFLLDAAGESFSVPDIHYEFAPSDAADRLPIEGMEEDGQIHTPASIARAELVAAFRAQARQIAIGGTNLVIHDVSQAAKTGGNEAIVRMTGDTLPSLRLVMPLNMSWADRIGVEDVSRLREEIDAATQRAANGALNVTQMLDSSVFSAERATMIIRTESAKVAMQEKLKKMGNMEKEWEISPGACEVCTELDGVSLPLGVKFPAKGAFGEVLTPPAHPNCRCTIIPKEIK